MKTDLCIFEGPDDSGKGTVLETCKMDFPHYFSGRPMMYSREPGGSDVGDDARGLLNKYGSKLHLGTELSLVWCRFNGWQEMMTWANKNPGGIIFLDRSYVSTFAYQVVGRDGREFCLKAFLALRDWLLNEMLPLAPELIVHHIYLNVTHEETARRRAVVKEGEDKDLSQFTDEDFQIRVHEGYAKYFEVHYPTQPFPERHTLDFVDGNTTPYNMFAQVRQIVKKYVAP